MRTLTVARAISEASAPRHATSSAAPRAAEIG